MIPISIRYAFRPVQRSLATGLVADLFGLTGDEPDHIVAENVSLDIRASDVVLFTGPSGSGKSSLLRAAGRQLAAIDAMALDIPEVPIIDALPGPIERRLELLSACGLAEARLLVRTPGELSDGQRYRFRLALAISTDEPWLSADEFAAYLDRTAAKVLAFNLRRLATRMGVGLLLATAHDDLTADLRPDLLVTCHGDGVVEQTRDATGRDRRPISFAGELHIEEGKLADWSAFARGHYRGGRPTCVKRVVVLKHGVTAIGICVFAAPAAALAVRSQYFGLSGPRTRLSLDALNRQLWVLARLVLHPTYRGAGIAARFVRQVCRECPIDWIEALSAMGHANPVFERAGFTRVGIVCRASRTTAGGQFGRRGRRANVPERHGEPVYYVFDNRKKLAS